MEPEKFKMENLKILRKQKNITQTKLSVDIEISQELVSQYELGKSNPTIENLVKIANYFNCSTDFLLGRTNIPTKINKIDKENIELSNVIEQYQSLSKENREHLKSYLRHLTMENN